MRLLTSFLLGYLFVRWARSNERRCPCQDGPLESKLSLPGPQMCVEVPAGSSSILNTLKSLKLGFGVVGVDQRLDQADCSVVVKLVPGQFLSPSGLCPGKCFPVPELILPLEWFAGKTQYTSVAAFYQSVGGGVHKDAPVTCSLELRQLLQMSLVPPSTATAVPGAVSIANVLRELFWRRIMECREQKFWRGSYQVALAEGDIRGVDRRNKPRWDSGSSSSNSNADPSDALFAATQPLRRKVECVVVWIGSVKSLPLIRTQAIMLQGQETSGSKAVIGWAATDDLYACRANSTWCAGGNKGNARYRYLPSSAMNWMSEGWRCGQRRPLRALAHVLLLFDPLYLILVDDDTLVNFPLLATRFASFIRGNMTHQPIVMGELLGKLGDQGHLSKGGIFAGGSGYILGRRLLRHLVAREVTYFGGQGMGWTGNVGGRDRYLTDFSDHYRSHDHVRFLNVLGEGYEYISKGVCDAWAAAEEALRTKRRNATVSSSEAGKNGTCILSLEPSLRGQAHRLSSLQQQHKTPEPSLHPKLDLVLPLAVRLIDYCVNLMASEHTCQHSDHSVGRCLVYGAFAAPINVVCNSTVPLADMPHDVRFPPAVPLEKDAQNTMLGMCFMLPACDVQLHTTCHRYRPSAAAGVLTAPQKLAALARFYTANRQEEASAAALSAFLAGAPEKTQNKGSYYRVFSSVWDGAMADSYG